MKNDLIHDGTLSRSRFRDKTATNCRRVVGGVLDWIDISMTGRCGDARA
jgi:hypothetical protein